jgi:simple sugar transport system substrate-binding protein
MKKLLVILFAAVIVVAVLAGCGRRGPSTPDTKPAVTETTVVQSTSTPAPTEPPAAKAKPNIVTVPRSADHWAELMQAGVSKFGTDNPGVTVLLKAPEKADGASQAGIIRDLLSQKVDALCVVPDSVETLDPIFKTAAGNDVKIVTNEGFTAKNAGLDLEAFDNAAYGTHLMDELARRMGEEGEYAVFVSSLNAAAENQWADAAIAWQMQKYPKMKLVGNKVETTDDPQKAYAQAKELLTAHPNLKGFESNGWMDAAGIGMAIEEAGIQDKTVVVGTSLVSTAGKYLTSGAVDMIAFWDPAAIGYACNKLALMLFNGQKPTEGMDLGLPGYDKLRQKDKVFYGQAWIDVTKDNMAKYNY